MKLFLSKNFKNNHGFTIIEVMIALAIFTVIVTIGIGAVLDATSQHARTQNIRTVMDDLNFVMEDMSRNIRLGSEIRCVFPGNDVPYPGYVDSTTGKILTADCPTSVPPSVPFGSNKIILKSVDGATRITYVISQTDGVVKQIGDNPIDAKSITPPEVVMDIQKSGFTVHGSAEGDQTQPMVTIRLAGTIKFKDGDSNFSIETTVVLRALDS
jgi:prepilin-type N-terminal cleavage/methylation domain-containing protein